MWLESAFKYIYRSEKLPGAIINDALVWKEEIVISLKMRNIFINTLGATVKLLMREFCIWHLDSVTDHL